MGVSASVRCRCWEDGLIPLPPGVAGLREDAEGYLEATAPNQIGDVELEQWLSEACAHKAMRQVDADLGNWPRYRSFCSTLARVHAGRCPTLLAELPQANGGLTGAGAAAQALAELDALIDSDPSEILPALIDTESGQVLRYSNPAYRGLFVLGCGPDTLDIGFDASGFTVRDANTRAVLFHATHFRQVLRAGGQRAVLTNLQTGQSCETAPIRGHSGHPSTTPRSLGVEQRVVGLRRHGPLLDDLQAVLQAAVETGNPIRWS